MELGKTITHMGVGAWSGQMEALTMANGKMEILFEYFDRALQIVIPASKLHLIKEVCDDDTPKVWANGKFDLFFLKYFCGIEVRGEVLRLRIAVAATQKLRQTPGQSAEIPCQEKPYTMTGWHPWLNRTHRPSPEVACRSMTQRSGL